MVDQGQPSTAPPASQNDMVCLADGSVAKRDPTDYKSLGTQQAAADFNAAVGRGWKFDDAQMSAYLKTLDGEVERLKLMRRQAEPLNQIKPMGNEIASQQAATVMNTSGAMAQASIMSSLNFLTAYVSHNHQVRDAYRNSDQTAIDALRGPGKDL